MDYLEFKNMFKDISVETTTVIQLDYMLNQYKQELKKYIGKEIEVNTTDLAGYKCAKLKDIELEFIHIEEFSFGVKTIIEFNSERFEKHLQTFKKGDYVKIIGILKHASFSKDKEYTALGRDYERMAYWFYGKAVYSFELISIENITNEVNLYCKNWSLERDKIEESKKKKESGCFIASACYGNYDSPEVKILRNYRDNVLVKSLRGKIAVKIYYLLSPPLARMILKSEMLKRVIRKYLLNYLITKIQEK